MNPGPYNQSWRGHFTFHIRVHLCQPHPAHMSPFQVLGRAAIHAKHPDRGPRPGPHPRSVATAHARQGPHGSQHQLRPLRVHELQEQGHAVVLEDPFSPCLFTAQYDEVVGSLKEGRGSDGQEEVTVRRKVWLRRPRPWAKCRVWLKNWVFKTSFYSSSL